MLIGLGFKVSAAPFHVWTPDVYQGAPAPVVGLMSTAPKAAAFAVLLRITFSGFPPMQHRWAILIWILAALSMTIGNLGALLQRDVKRMLAYSSIAHAGYLLVAFTAFPHDGIAAACFYTAAYAAMNVGAFAVITQVAGYDENLRTIDDYTGLAARRPVLAALLAFFLLSLIGIPFTGGFFGKFYVFSAAIGSGHVWLAVIGLSTPASPASTTSACSPPSTRSPTPTQLSTPPSPSPASPPPSASPSPPSPPLILGILPGNVLSMAQYAGTSTMIEDGPPAMRRPPRQLPHTGPHGTALTPSTVVPTPVRYLRSL